MLPHPQCVSGIHTKRCPSSTHPVILLMHRTSSLLYPLLSVIHPNSGIVNTSVVVTCLPGALLTVASDCSVSLLQALRLLSIIFVQSNPSLKQQAVLQLLQHSVALGRTHSVAAQALKTLQSYDDELFGGRVDAPDSKISMIAAASIVQIHEL